MTKEVMITISGFRITDGEQEAVELTVRGDYYRKNGNHYLLYQETEDGGEKSRSRIRISPGSMDIKKSGAHLIFEKDRKHVSGYMTPAGELTVGILTEKLEMREDEDQLETDLEYSLEINGSHVSDCRIRVSARSLKQQKTV